MAEEQKHDRLGRGLSALLGDTDFDVVDAPAASGAPGALPIEFLRPNPFQPRRLFNEESIDELAASIKQKGIIQPIVVRPVEGEINAYQIVAGERRWRAAQKAAIHEVPVIIRTLSDLEMLELSLIENVQRTDLNPIEEAAGYRVLMEQFQYTQEQLSQMIGKSRSHVANLLRLLGLSDHIQEQIIQGLLSAGHGRALLGATDARALAEKIVKEGLNVRQAEALAKPGRAGPGVRKAPSAPPEKDADTLSLENNISNILGLKISINHQGETGGHVLIAYKTLEQLDDICRRLSRD